MADVTLELRFADGGLIGVVEGNGISWQELERDAGSGTVTVPLTAPSPILSNLIKPDRIVRVLLDGAPVWEWLTRPLQRALADEQGGYITVSGPGARALLDIAMVYAVGACYLTEQRERVLGYQDVAYDTSAHPLAWSHGTQGSNPFDDQGEGGPRPHGWPVVAANAHLIWSPPPASHPIPGGHPNAAAAGVNLLWSPIFPIAASSDYLLLICADDEYDVWINGMKIGESRGAFRWRGFETYPMILCPGNYRIAVRGNNLDRTEPTGVPQSPAWVLAALCESTGAGDIITVAHATSTAWRVLAYPAGMVGLTPGHIIRILLAEATARGPTKLANVTLAFTDTHDSAGLPWALQLEIPVEVDRTSITAVLESIEAFGFDARMAPNLVLHVWNARGTDRTGTVTLNRLGNASSWSRDNAVANVLRSEGPNGPVESTHPDSINREGRYEAFYELDEMGVEAVRQRQVAGLEDILDGYEVGNVQVADEDGPSPYDAFEWGDTITTVDALAVPAAHRVSGWLGSVDNDNGALVWTVATVVQP